jgi:hypothetical protein
MLPLALAATLGACSGDSEPEYQDPDAAMDAAEAAAANNDSAAAESGFQYALDTGDSATQAEALLGLFHTYVADGKEAAATAAFERLTTEFGDSLDPETLTDLITNVSDMQMADLGSSMLGFAVENHPEMQDSLGVLAGRIDAIHTEAPAASNLGEIGYAGDEPEVPAIPAAEDIKEQTAEALEAIEKPELPKKPKLPRR